MIAKCCLRPDGRGRGGASFGILKRVPHFGPLRLEVTRVMRVRLAPNRHLLDHLNSVALQANDFLGIIRQEPELADAEIEKDLRAESVIAEVAREPETRVCFDRIESLLL